jgi:integrase
MSSLTITTRRAASGPRYVVRFRLGGRAYPVVHAGSFKTLKEAKVRRDLVAGEIAAGRNPAELLRTMLEPVEIPAVKLLDRWAAEYQASRIDYADDTAKNTGSHLRAILPTFGSRDPHTITFADVQMWVGGLELKPSSVRRYVATLRLLLDYAGVDPNPARDKRVKLPTIVAEEPQPPTAREFLAILDHTSDHRRLPLVLMEQTAMTIGETHSLEWGDVDVAGCMIRLRRRNVKGQIRSRARQPQVPGWLMELLTETCPLEDRTAERRVFPGFTTHVAQHTMERACRDAGIPRFSPHDLRHRRLSLWHGQGVPAKELAARAGHSKASMTLDVYSTSCRSTSASSALCRRLSGRSGVVPVWSQRPHRDHKPFA